MNTVVSFKEVIKRYHSTLALDKLSFDISNSECVGLIGNNGSGKSTIINILGNIISYDAGDVYYNYKRINPNFISYKREIGMILSKPYYIKEFSVFMYLKFLGAYFQVPKEALSDRISSLLKILKLEHRMNSKISSLSSGNQMKISLAASLIHDPKVLLYDEPFVHLDIRSIDVVTQMINTLKKFKTFLITSHNLDLVVDLCDKFIIIDGGKLLTTVNRSEFSNNSELKNDLRSLLVTRKTKIELDWLYNA
jgi:ABC-2 type transport system ATP-binding protein